LSLDTPILTPSGFKPIGDIKDGETVFNENGDPVRVIHSHDIINDAESYRTSFCNGSHIDACKDHQWLTWTKADRTNERRGLKHNPSVKSTLDIFNTQMCGKEFNHSIQYTKPIGLERKNLLIDPYILGLWLGDGGTTSAKFSSIDEPILDYIRSKYVVTKLKGDNCDYYIRGLSRLLRSEGVLGNKHVPHN